MDKSILPKHVLEISFRWNNSFTNISESCVNIRKHILYLLLLGL